jgi:Zn-dependent protease
MVVVKEEVRPFLLLAEVELPFWEQALAFILPQFSIWALISFLFSLIPCFPLDVGWRLMTLPAPPASFSFPPTSTASIFSVFLPSSSQLASPCHSPNA